MAEKGHFAPVAGPRSMGVGTQSQNNAVDTRKDETGKHMQINNGVGGGNGISVSGF